MSDASVRNFCTYTCVMTFQAQFEVQHVPPGSAPKSAPPPPSSATPGQFFPPGAPVQPHQQSQVPAAREAGRGRMTTRQGCFMMSLQDKYFSQYVHYISTDLVGLFIVSDIAIINSLASKDLPRVV